MKPSLPETGLDRHVALSRVGGDEELLKEIAAIFLDDYPKGLAEIREALAGGDAKKLESAAHSMKGSVGNFGAQAAVESAFRLEQMGREKRLQPDGPEAAAAKQACEALEQALSALRLELEAL
jgi:HPt (histidine-containing phosphotransfer) domain-containing protein